MQQPYHRKLIEQHQLGNAVMSQESLTSQNSQVSSCRATPGHWCMTHFMHHCTCRHQEMSPMQSWNTTSKAEGRSIETKLVSYTVKSRYDIRCGTWRYTLQWSRNRGGGRGAGGPLPPPLPPLSCVNSAS